MTKKLSPQDTSTTSLLFICLGNICRSPAAEAVMRKVLKDADLTARFHVDSAGTGDWHIGELADPRMRSAGTSRGYELTHRARQVSADDFQRFDLLITMDESNYRNVARLAPSADAVAKIHRFPTFCTRHQHREVPDPYHGSSADFSLVLDILEDGCQGLLTHLNTKTFKF